jgi:mRNA interferase MazF
MNGPLQLMMRPMPTSDRTIKCGDVVVMPFPYSDKLAEKRRPALVVSSDKFNKTSGYLWVVMITSQTRDAAPDDVVFDHAKAGLSRPSVVRVSKIATIEAERVIRIAGKMEKRPMASVRKHAEAILG